jgi:hypothetical protein
METLMSTATFQITLTPKRMLSEGESARHCGRSPKRFKLECPVQPIRFPNGDIRYDVRDLDAWLDSLKAGAANDDDAIIKKLGA